MFFPEFLIFKQNNSAETSVLIFFMAWHYYFFFFENVKIVEKNLHKLNCSYDKVSYTLKLIKLMLVILFLIVVFWVSSCMSINDRAFKCFEQKVVEQKERVYVYGWGSDYSVGSNIHT